MATLRELIQLVERSSKGTEAGAELEHGLDADLGLAGDLVWDLGEKAIGVSLNQLNGVIETAKRLAAAAA
jgi:hypothetical protein